MGGDLTSGAAAGGWRVVAASVQGVLHERDGAPCQDAHAFAVLPDGTLATAVADGAGSAPLGGVGARIAVAAALDALRGGAATGDDPGERLVRAARAAAAAVAREAAARAAVPAELATTLILLLATGEGVVAARVGDGAAVVRVAGGSWRALTAGATGEYVNETVFLTAPDMDDHLTLHRWNGRADAVALLTDGVEELAVQRRGGTPHGAFFDPMAALATEPDPATAALRLRAFLSGDRVRARATDDLTLLVGVRG